MGKEHDLIGQSPKSPSDIIQPGEPDAETSKRQKEHFKDFPQDVTLMQLIMDGKTKKDIIARLGVDYETVRRRKNTIYRLFGVKTATGAAFKAEDLGVISHDNSSIPFNPELFSDLTRDEQEIFDCYYQNNGDINISDMARALNVTEFIIKKHTKSARTKLEVEDLTVPALAYRKLVLTNNKPEAKGTDKPIEKPLRRKVTEVYKRQTAVKYRTPLTENEDENEDTQQKIEDDLPIEKQHALQREEEAKECRAKKRLPILHNTILALEQHDPTKTPNLKDKAFLARAAQAGITLVFEHINQEHIVTENEKLSYLVGLAYFMGLEDKSSSRRDHRNEMDEAMSQIRSLMKELIAKRNQKRMDERMQKKKEDS